MAGYRPRSLQVTLHIYDLIDLNRYGHPVGLGAFHSGVEVGGLEFSFGGHEFDSSGIFTITPKEAPGVIYRESVEMGETKLSLAEIYSIADTLAKDFKGINYHIFTRYDFIRFSCF
eukprot:TRINITY_DN1327_c0_g1_i1.p1 TRINITY_DN1327_c0_g1~~TRINITY_DN1327_c0_g1_i1.p1  ORF type:complete len:135 (-),score=15.87 TRINITY_DN1327_c0_g1_i1:389-736(-)